MTVGAETILEIHDAPRGRHLYLEDEGWRLLLTINSLYVLFSHTMVLTTDEAEALHKALGKWLEEEKHRNAPTSEEGERDE